MKKLLGILLIVLIAAAAIVAFYGDGEAVPEEPADNGRIKVIASFYPLAHFAEKVGGDIADVELLTKAGSDPHSYEASPQDIIRAQSADLFIFQGAGFDSWAERIVSNIESSDVKIVKITQSFELMESGEEEEEEHEDEHDEEEHEEDEEEHEHEHGAFDPHIWLSPKLSGEIVNVIANALSELVADEQKEIIFANAAAYKEMLADLDTRFESGLAECTSDKIVVAHDAFGYMAREYGLEVISIAGISPQSQPSSRRLAELADILQKEEIKYVFFETLTSPKLADTLAEEVGAQTLVLNPLEGLTAEQIEAGEDYISVMEDNLKNLQTALGC